MLHQEIQKLNQEPKIKTMILKIRASASGTIMTKGEELTAKQASDLLELIKKKNEKGLTVAQQATFDKLQHKKENPDLADTVKAYLEERFIALRYGRSKDMVNRYVTKGLNVEEDSLTLYSRFKNKFFIKNVESFSNEFLTGTPDIIEDDEIIDIKSSWDLWTFTKSKRNINRLYYWQLQAYMALTGKKFARLVYCLIDTPDILFQDELRRLQFKMGVIDDSSPDFQDAAAALYKEHHFDDIPIAERVFEWRIERDDKAIENLYNRVKQCREYFKSLFP
jgi:hypothetical protein